MVKILLIMGFMLCASWANAAEAEKQQLYLAGPAKALLSPVGGSLQVSQKLPVSLVDGREAISFVIPGDASNLQIHVLDHEILRWSSSPTLLNEPGENLSRREIVEKEQIETRSALATVNTRLALWQVQPQSITSEEMSNLQSAIQAAMPGLFERQAELEQKLKLLNDELARLPQTSGLGQLITVFLQKTSKPEVEVNYAYDYPGCGWNAVYNFNAQPNGGGNDIVDVQLMAEIWQFTGIDWKDTQITLVTKGQGSREPRPLPEWIIESNQPKPQPRVMARKMEAAGAVNLTADSDMAIAVANSDSLFSSWELNERGLAQGHTRIRIKNAAWQAPLQWLARPSKGNTQVWLLAKYDLPADEAWPAGLAEYSVNGQSVGSGAFEPHKGAATLYFGADPRVTVITSADRKHGEQGLIRASKTWTWAWTYTIYNQHNKAINVRVERPMPMVVEQNVKLAYNNTPPAKENLKEHYLYWDVAVPANGQTVIQHAVTLTSPTTLQLLPDVP